MKLFIPALLSIFLISSCNSGNKKSGNETDMKVDLKEILSAADAISPDVNSVEDVFKTLDMANAKYFPILCNDPYNAQNYLTSLPNAASNLGVYITDIVYHKYGDDTEKMYLAFSASQELARYIGIESEFAATLLVELESGEVSRDSLIVVFNDLMNQSKEYNTAEDMMHVHAAFLSGLYIEKIYITSSLLVQGQKKEDPSEQDIVNYKKLLVLFMKQLETIDRIYPSVENYKNKLKKIYDLGQFIELQKDAVNLDQVSDDILNSDKIVDSPEINAINKLIKSIRTGIVSAS